MLHVLFELPCEKYLAFRYVASEIIENISFVLNEKGPDGNYPIQETQKFIQFITPGFKNSLTVELTARCFLKLCSHTKSFIHVHNTEIINTLIPETVKDWLNDDSTKDRIEGLVVLILAEEDSTKCHQLLEMLLKKIIDPLVENINWIKSHQKQKGALVVEKDIN